MKLTQTDNRILNLPHVNLPLKRKDISKFCDICGHMGTYGNGKTWNRCFTHLNTEPKPKI